MNRLEKKCLLGSAVLHGAVAVTLLLTTAFSGKKADDEYVSVMNMVDTATLTDDKTSGVSAEVQPPAPTPAPPQPAPQQIQPQPVQPPVSRPPEEKQPVVTPPPKPVEPPPTVRRETPKAREPEPEINVANPKDLRADVKAELPTKADTKKKKITLDPVDRSTSKAKTKEAPVRPSIDLAKVVKRDTNKIQQDKEAQERADQIAAEATARRQAEQRRNALANAVRGAGTAVQVGVAGQTKIDIAPGVGGGGAAYLNYGQFVRAAFEGAWIRPVDPSNDNATVKVSVTVAKDGRIVSSSISEKSGDRAVDRSIEDVLRRVKQIRAFPAGAEEATRSYVIEFNLKSRGGIG